MTKWELTSLACDMGITADLGKIWSHKDKKTGKSAWDNVSDLAAQGWELVSVTQITWAGTANTLLYTFKRPIEDS